MPTIAITPQDRAVLFASTRRYQHRVKNDWCTLTVGETCQHGHSLIEVPTMPVCEVCGRTMGYAEASISPLDCWVHSACRDSPPF